MNDTNRLRWNIGSWLGAQLGGSCWILVAGVLALRFDVSTALLVIFLFVIPNLIGLAIWRQRERVSAYAGMQLLLPILGAFGLAAVFLLERAAIFEKIQIGASVTATSTYGIILLVVAALMLLFYLQFGRNSAD